MDVRDSSWLLVKIETAVGEETVNESMFLYCNGIYISEGDMNRRRSWSRQYNWCTSVGHILRGDRSRSTSLEERRLEAVSNFLSFITVVTGLWDCDGNSQFGMLRSTVLGFPVLLEVEYAAHRGNW